jgi:hypothetical protein
MRTPIEEPALPRSPARQRRPALLLSIVLAAAAVWSATLACGPDSRLGRSPDKWAIEITIHDLNSSSPGMADTGGTGKAAPTAGPTAATMDAPMVAVAVTLRGADGYVDLGATQALTCNDVPLRGGLMPTPTPLPTPGILPRMPTYTASVPRQPPGGTYTFAYTDAHGAVTRVRVPAWMSTLAVTAPRPGDAVVIPPDSQSQLNVHLANPLAPRVTTLSFTLDIMACYGTSDATCGMAYGSFSVSGRDNDQAYTLHGTFSNFQPGPGMLVIQGAVRLNLNPPISGFGETGVNYFDQGVIPITWTR